MEKTYRCTRISKGQVSGPALVSRDAVCFYLAVPETGEIIEKNHDIQGRSVAGTVLVMPSGKGSSVVQADGLYKLLKNGCQPAGMIVETADTVLVTAAVAMEIPMVHKVDQAFFEQVADGMKIKLDADQGLITVCG